MTAGHDDELIVADLLEGIEGTGTLRPVLLELRALAHGPVPMPSPELAKLMGSTVVPLAGRRRTRHRTVIFSLAVVTAMGVGTTAAAAVSPEFRATTQHVITGIVSGLTPGGASPAAPAPAPEPSTVNGPANSKTTHPTPRPTPTDSIPPQTPAEPNPPSHGQSDPLTPAKPVLPVPPSQKDHTPGIPPTPTPHKIWTGDLVPGTYDEAVRDSIH